MKHLFLAFSILWCSLSAQAIHDPSWERPILSAALIELNEAGQEIKHGLMKELTLHKRDGAYRPTQITYIEESHNICPMIYMSGYECPLLRKDTKTLRVLAAEKDSCGSIRYTAQEINPMHPNQPLAAAAVINLIDRTHSLCDDGGWQVSLIAPGQNPRSFVGKPEVVVTIE